MAEIFAASNLVAGGFQPTENSFSELDLVVAEDAITWMVMCAGKRIIIELSGETLCRNEKFCAFLGAFNGTDEADEADDDVYSAFVDWVLLGAGIEEYFADLLASTSAPLSSPKPATTLLDYYGAEAIVLEVVMNQQGKLEVVKHPEPYHERIITKDDRRRIRIVDHLEDIPAVGAEEDITAADDEINHRRVANNRGDTTDTNTIRRSILPPSSAVPFFPASQLVRSGNSVEDIQEQEKYCSEPRQVRDIKTGQEYEFHAVAVESCRQKTHREIQILGCLSSVINSLSLAAVETAAADTHAHTGEDADQDHDQEHEESLVHVSSLLRTSRLAGLVYWDGEEDVLMGILLDRIDGERLSDHTQASRASTASSPTAADKEKWMDQIDETIGQLHKHGLVWGNAQLENVVINSSGDAILVDFRGVFDPRIVDQQQQFQNTVEGDLQGVKEMRMNLLGGDQENEGTVPS